MKKINEWLILSDPVKQKILVRCSCWAESRAAEWRWWRPIKTGKSKSCGCKTAENLKNSNIEKYGRTTALADKELMKKAMRSKYGVDNCMELESTKQKIATTVKERYGVDNPLKIEEHRKKGEEKAWSEPSREKRKRTYQEKFGVDHPAQNPAIKEKSKRTNTARWGVDNFSKTKEFKDLMSAKNPMKDPAIKQRFFDSLQERHGVSRLTEMESFKQSIIRHRIGSQSLRTFMKTNGIDHVQYDAVARVFRKYDEKTALEYIEKRKIERLSSLELAFKKLFPTVEKFDRKVLKNAGYRPDFRLSETVFVNTDGLYHHNEMARDRNYHFKLREAFEAEGMRILQFYSDEIEERFEIVKSIIQNALGQTQEKVHARKCEIIPIRMSEASLILDLWHLMGRGAPAKAISLVDEKGRTVSIMTYRNNKNDIEISRFASMPGINVAGGFGKLVSSIQKLEPGKTIISFCDLRYSTGHSYEKTGFKSVGEHVSFCWTDNIKRYGRRYCRASDGKTESQNAEEMGIVKIFDAGQRKYVLSPK